MNDRLKELAREAGFYANPDVQKFQKFAELIINECASIANEHMIECESINYGVGTKIKRELIGMNNERTN